jgi:hypothetical protein
LDRRMENCSLFLNAGSIPGTGLSFFAGRNYTAGELLLETRVLYPLSTEQEDTFFVPPHALLLKHHPHFSNVEGLLLTDLHDGSITQFELRASKLIKAGEEFFVGFQHHPQSMLTVHGFRPLFDHIPTAPDYETADKITNDVIRTISQMQKTQKKNKQFNSDYVYSLLKRSVGNFNTRVASLLPRSSRDAGNKQRALGVPSVYSAVHNRSLTELQISGTCVDDLRRVSVSGSTDIVLLNRNVKKGDILAKIPLLVLKKRNGAFCAAEQQQCTISPLKEASTSSCFGQDDVHMPILVCPLNLEAALIEPTVADDANVEYRWEDENVRIKSLNDLIRESPAVSLVWNVVALSDIRVGEKVS